MSFQLTDEQWEAIRSVRTSWPDDIDWVLARDAIEHLGQDELLKRSLRWGWGSPVKIRNNLRKALRLTHELQAVISELPAPLLGSSSDPNLEEQVRRIEDLLPRYEYFAGPAFRGRSDPYRNHLEHLLFGLWKGSLRGDFSFSRNLDGIPCGPLVEFLTLTLRAITGSAPGPDGIAKIIDQYRKKKSDFPF